MVKSKNYQRKRQNLNGYVVVTSDKIFDKDKPRKGVKSVARVSKDIPYLTKFNPKTKKNVYMASLDSLPIKTKNEIIKHFDGKKRVLYLVDKK